MIWIFSLSTVQTRYSSLQHWRKQTIIMTSMQHRSLSLYINVKYKMFL